MIRSKEDYKYYIIQDDKMRFGDKCSWIIKLRAGKSWLFMRTLRRYEYIANCKNGLFFKAVLGGIKLYYRHLSYTLGWTVPINTCGPGLCIVHIGTAVISDRAVIGKNCRMHAGVNIGAFAGGAPHIGDSVYIGPGAKLYGNIEIASHCAIGANAVVNSSFLEPGITIAGIPAGKVSNKGSAELIGGGSDD